MKAPRPQLLAGVQLTAVVPRDIDQRVADAIERVPRHDFVAPERRMTAYLDTSSPLRFGRRCPRPATLGRLFTALGSTCTGPVLVVGVGTGYAAAVARELYGTVVAVESHDRLRADAREILERQRAFSGEGDRCSQPQNVQLVGSLREAASLRPSYSKVVLCGAVRGVGPRLRTHLADGGRLIAPVLHEYGVALRCFERSGNRLSSKSIAEIHIEALPGGYGL